MRQGSWIASLQSRIRTGLGIEGGFMNLSDRSYRPEEPVEEVSLSSYPLSSHLSEFLDGRASKMR